MELGRDQPARTARELAGRRSNSRTSIVQLLQNNNLAKKSTIIKWQNLIGAYLINALNTAGFETEKYVTTQLIG